MTRDLELIYTATSIKGLKIPSDTQLYLERFAHMNALSHVEIGTGSDFSKPMSFFSSQPVKFQYLIGDELTPYEYLFGRDFIAFSVKRQTLFVFGYFAGEYS